MDKFCDNRHQVEEKSADLVVLGWAFLTKNWWRLSWNLH